jgi:pentose-5-phosphate-3-epimerase
MSFIKGGCDYLIVDPENEYAMFELASKKEIDGFDYGGDLSRRTPVQIVDEYYQRPT